MPSPFSSANEFKHVMDELFTIMSEDPEMGPALIPITKPVYARYREMVEQRHPHLVV